MSLHQGSVWFLPSSEWQQCRFEDEREVHEARQVHDSGTTIWCRLQHIEEVATFETNVTGTYLQMLDKALNMLGPDAEILSEILTDRKSVSTQNDLSVVSKKTKFPHATYRL